MKSIIRNCLYFGKIFSRDYGFLFWTLLYPLILASFFHATISGIGNIKYEDINIGIEKENPFIQVLDEIEMVNLLEISKDEVEAKLKSEAIDGFIKEDLDIIVDRSGINQTIIGSIAEEIKQIVSLDLDRENLDFNANYIREEEERANSIMIIFYSLIAMVASYSNFAGIETAILVQGNLSNIAARLNMTPLKKRNFLISGIIVALFLNLIANSILILFMKYAFNLKLLNDLRYSLIFILLGNLFGVSLGVFIGVSNKRSVGAKTMLSIIATLFLSFLSGLMAPDIKVLIDKNMPLLARINPISIISNSLYRINILDSRRDIRLGMVLLFVYSLVLIIGSYMFLRRQNYDSI